MISTEKKAILLTKPRLLRWEIGIALLIKAALLTGLWFLIFRWPDKPVVKPDIAAHFIQVTPPSRVNPVFVSQPPEESRHDR